MKSERELIRRIAADSPPEARLGDDMAWIDARDPSLLWTVDMLMDGVDFRSEEHGWEPIGRKALAVNLSDCAAMAVRPCAALVAVALNNRLSLDDALAIHAGVRRLAAEFDCSLTGGDTNSWDHPTVISISVAARAERDCMPVGRDGAHAGHTLWLTGPVGGSILGRHLTFTPRVREALRLAAELRPSALIDISDGLALDADRLGEASEVGIELDRALLERVIHPDAQRLAARDGRPPLEHALSDGEDFELLVALPESTPTAAAVALGLLPIGRCISARGLYMRESDGASSPLEPRGWEHFCA